MSLTHYPHKRKTSIKKRWKLRLGQQNLLYDRVDTLISRISSERKVKVPKSEWTCRSWINASIEYQYASYGIHSRKGNITIS